MYRVPHGSLAGDFESRASGSFPVLGQKPEGPEAEEARMGGLCLVRDQAPELEETALDKVRAQFARYGFPALRQRHIPG